MSRPSRKDAQAAVRGNQEAADKARVQGREKDAQAADAAVQEWQRRLASS